MSLPSSVPFVSLFHYSPRGTEHLSPFSREFTYAVKRDSHVQVRNKDGSTTSIHAITRISQSIAMRIDSVPFVARCFTSNTTLVPVPRSSPMKRGWLWPTHRICESIVSAGLANSTLPCIERVRPVTTSSKASAGERPMPLEHYNSCRVSRPPLLPEPKHITLLDDVITRGSTLLAAYALLQEAFPDSTISCFAVVRTESDGEVTSLADPIQGTIVYENGQTKRRP